MVDGSDATNNDKASGRFALALRTMAGVSGVLTLAHESSNHCVGKCASGLRWVWAEIGSGTTLRCILSTTND